MMKVNLMIKDKKRTAVFWMLVLLAGISILSCKKLDFTKTEIIPPAGDKWLYYDNGLNYTGINANSGGAFDIAIRFNASQLSNYDGFEISQIKFFPLEGYPATYSVTIWEGYEPPTLLHVQSASVISDTWNSVTIDDYFAVDASQDLWIGVWVQNYPAGTYPAGCDAGPAVAGKGDLYSNDNGVTWNSMSISDALDYNWNLQVFVSDPYGKKVILAPATAADETGSKKTLQLPEGMSGNPGMSSQN